MKNNSIVIPTNNVEGNVGSCSVVSTDIQTGMFYQQTVAVNSCTGETIKSTGEYLKIDSILVYLILAIGMVALVVASYAMTKDL